MMHPPSAVVAVYTKCPGGEFFLGRTCPLDGRKPEAAQRLADVLLRIEESACAITYAALVDHGFPASSLDQLLILIYPAGAAPWPYFRPLITTNCPRCKATIPSEYLAQNAAKSSGGLQL
jgi:hypothetical protein